MTQPRAPGPEPHGAVPAAATFPSFAPGELPSARRSEDTLRFLSEASARLAATLDYERTLNEIARLAVPFLADWCAVDVLDDAGGIRQLAVAHVEPGKVALAREVHRRFPPPADAPTGAPHVIRTGRSEVLHEIDDALLARTIRDPELRALIVELGLRASIVAPMSARGRTFGAISLVMAESRRRFDASDVAVAEDLARRAAVAVDNARLYRDARQAQDRLQVALDAGRLGPWEWDVRRGKVVWSPAVERIHGMAEGSFDGTFEAYQRDMHPDDRARVLGEIQRTLAERRPRYQVTYRIVRADGAVRWLDASGQLFFDAQGEPLRLVGVCADVTERKEAEAFAKELEVARAAHGEAEAARARTREILESITDPFIVVDHAWRVAFANEAAATLSSRPVQKLLGAEVWRAFPPAADPEFEAALRRARAEGVAVTFEHAHAATARWFEVHAYPTSSGLSVYAREVSARRRAEELQRRLTRAAALRADVAAALADGATVRAMLQQCTDAVVRHLPVSFARIWLRDPHEEVLVLEASSGKYVHLDGGHARVPVGALKIGKIASERRPHLTNDVQHDPRVNDKEWARREGMVAFAGYPLLAGDSLVGVIAAFATQPLDDATIVALASVADAIAQGVQRKRAELALDERARELARSNADLEQFAYVASHDLQEPLRMVTSYVQLLARRYKGKLDADADDFIGFAVDGVTRMQGLIQDLLAFSRVGRAMARAPVQAERALDRALRDLGGAIAESGGEITRGPLAPVVGDEAQIAQLFQNLVGNALKFRREGAPPRVHVASERETDFVHFTVADDGVGIEPEFFDRIFLVFQRLQPRSERPGNGIGLAICKKIVERHGGRIWVESRPGEGSTFHFTLPAGAP